MRTSRFREAGPGTTTLTSQAGMTLIEVLVAIFVTGIGLLALLTLFPLGALDMAQAVKDDRAAAVAASAEALSEAGKALLSRTTEFIVASLMKGSVDPQVVARLRADYEHLLVQAGDLEVKLEELESATPRPLIQRHLPLLQTQIRSIKQHVGTVVRLLSLVGNAP